MNPVKAHFELFTQQGPFLEKENKEVGIITCVQAYSWILANLKVRAYHTDTTPMDMRAGSYLVASKMAIPTNKITKKHSGLGSVAEIHVSPNFVNVIPEATEFIIDVRHVTDEGLMEIVVYIEK